MNKLRKNRNKLWPNSTRKMLTRNYKMASLREYWVKRREKS